jgi:integrase
MIEDVRAVPTAMNMDVAQETYFHGMKLALAEIDRRYGGARIEDEGLVDRLRLAKNDPPKPPSAIAGSAVDRPDDPPTAGASPIPQFVPMAEFARFADGVIQLNAADGHWDEKTQRQAKSISSLFIKFMVQDQHVHDLNLVGQTQVGKFADFLRLEIYKHYGKSVRDEERTIEELRAKGRSVERTKRGIGADTLNRHWTFIGQIFNYAIARGYKCLEGIDLTKLRAKGRNKDRRARDERLKLPIDSAKAIFQTPPFINCAGWDDLGTWGEQGAAQVFHCALYFVPILIYYMGARREELCGAMVDDVIFDREGCRPYIHIVANEQRRIKNAQSKRNIPIHPELIRLGFLDYVRKIKALGYKLLFPDLYSPSTRSPLGNRFYKLFKPILTAAEITEEGLGAHAVRHLFGAQLKKKLLSKEDRADLLGHAGDSETSERYCEPHELDTLFEFIMKLEVITGHLVPLAINLIPWVENKEVAPFSQPSRAKRRSADRAGF